MSQGNVGFDLSRIINLAQQVTEKQENGGSNYGPRLVYPNLGTLTVKLLYNPPSGTVLRLINRHKNEDGSQSVCLKTYGEDCPICKALDNIKNATGVDLWKYKSKARGIAYAQYVSSQNYNWEGKEPKVGELILLMYPWTVYTDINRIISMAGVHAEELVAKNSGKVVSISRWRDSNQEKYKAEVNAFVGDFKSKADDAEFLKFLNEIPNLNDTISPAMVTQDVLKELKTVADALTRNYLRNVNQEGIQVPGSVINNPAPVSGQQVIEMPDGSAYAVVNGQYMLVRPALKPTITPVAPQTSPVFNPYVPTVTFPNINPAGAQTVGNTNQEGFAKLPGAPECFSKHPEQPNPKCLTCLYEIQCKTVS